MTRTLCQEMEAIETALCEELEGLVSTFLSLPIARGFHLTMCGIALRDREQLESIMIPPQKGQEAAFRSRLHSAMKNLKELSDDHCGDEGVEIMRSMNVRRSFYEGHIRDNNLNGQYAGLEEPLHKVATARTELYRFYGGLSAEFPDVDSNVVQEAAWRASLRYDPSLGYGFPAYAQHWISVFAQRHESTQGTTRRG